MARLVRVLSQRADGGDEDVRGVAFVDPAGPDLATISEDTISRITDMVSEQTGQWRDRPWNGSGPEGNVGGMLWGRAAESARLDALFADAAAGRGGVVVVRGEPGVGKSALLSEASSRASGARVLWTQGIESESPLAFAALHRLLRPCCLTWTGCPRLRRVRYAERSASRRARAWTGLLSS
jgi:hypothetical protein